MENNIVKPQIEAAQVSLQKPTEVFGTLCTMYIGKVHQNDTYRVLYKFPINMIPGECMIMKAILRVYVQGGEEDTVTLIKTFALSEDWCTENVTWNNQPSFFKNVSGETVKVRKPGFYHFNITQIVQKWYENEISNYGIVMTGEEQKRCKSSYKKIIPTVNYTLGPQVEISFLPKPNRGHGGCCTKFIEKLEDIDTCELYHFSKIINMSLTKTITFHIENLGNSTVEVLLQLSPDGINYLNDSPESIKIEGKNMIYLIPYTFAKYGRIAVRNIIQGQTSRIRIWYQAQE